MTVWRREALIVCLNGHENPETYVFCGVCGAELRETLIVCPNGHDNPGANLFCGECGTELEAPDMPRQHRFGAALRKFWDAATRNPLEAAQYLGILALCLGALALLAVAGYLFYDLLQFVINYQKNITAQAFVGVVINEILLVFIIVELVETAYHQVEIGISDGVGRALGKSLAKKLLIIGLLASIRHLLAIGVELSGRTYPSGSTLSDVLTGLAVTTGMVIGLALVLVIVVRGYPFSDDDEEADRSKKRTEHRIQAKEYRRRGRAVPTTRDSASERPDGAKAPA
jgi:hypothetical protein